MPVTEYDVLLLKALARYYVLTREQFQRLCFPAHSGGRSTRKRLLKLQSGDFVQKHRVPVAFPGTTNAAPVYYLTTASDDLETVAFLAMVSQMSRTTERLVADVT